MAVRPTLRLSVEDAGLLLPLMVQLVRAQMRRAGPNRPRVVKLIEDRKIRYSRHDPDEHWQTYDEILEQIARRGFAVADCEDLSMLLSAELQEDGHDQSAYPYVYQSAPGLSHVVVHTRWGVIDPSRAAGMGWHESQIVDHLGGNDYHLLDAWAPR